MNAAIVHDFTVGYAGSERVVEQLLEVLPDATVHVVADFLSDKDRRFLGGRKPITSFIQRLPFSRKMFRNYLALMPIAIEQLDMSPFDVIVSSNHAVAKGVIIGPDQLHISYVHSPIRYAWDLQHQYLAESGAGKGIKGLITRAILHYMRLWDQSSSNRVNVFVANSRYIARRIANTYHRHAEVIYPPVNVDAFELQETKESFYLTASRMVPYKRMPLLVEAFRAMPDKKLVMIGDGPELEKVKAMAPANVKVMGYQSFDVLRDHMQRAKAFVFAAEEDFGITPVEAMACGTPVIAFGSGGVTESVIDGETGLFFDEQTPESVVEAVERFERNQSVFEPAAIRRRAEYFRPERFREEFASLLEREWAAFEENKRGHTDLPRKIRSPRPLREPVVA